MDTDTPTTNKTIIQLPEGFKPEKVDMSTFYDDKLLLRCNNFNLSAIFKFKDEENYLLEDKFIQKELKINGQSKIDRKKSKVMRKCLEDPYFFEKTDNSFNLYTGRMKFFTEVTPFDNKFRKFYSFKVIKMDCNNDHLHRFSMVVNLKLPTYRRYSFVQQDRIANLRNRKVLKRLTMFDSKYDVNNGQLSKEFKKKNGF